MKILILIASILSFTIQAKISQSCDVISYGNSDIAGHVKYDFAVANTTYSFSDETSSIEIIQDAFLTDIEFGENHFSYDSIISTKESDKKTTYMISDQDNKTNLKLTYYKGSKKGVLFGKRKSEEKYELLITFDCNDYGHLEKPIKNATRKMIKKIKFKDLPSAVRKAMRDVDVAFEYGDGYYDTIWSTIYEVHSKTGEVIGYVKTSALSYTEDSDTVHNTDYYYSNGIRFETGLGVFNL